MKSKRPIKLTYKALAETVEKLQNVRKSKLIKLKSLRKITQEFMKCVSVKKN